MNTITWLAATLVALLLGCAYHLDGPDEMAAIEATAAQAAEEDTVAAADARRAEAEAECTARHGRDALFFKTQHGHLVCRDVREARGAV